RLQNLLRHAIERSDLELHYQPIVELRTGRLVGFEALTRWSPPELGTVSPAEFIPIAEETGLVVPLGRWVFEEACRHYSEWREEFPAASQLQVSVNVSSRQLMEREMMEHISQVVAQYKITPSQLKVEVTESAIMDNMDEAAAILQQLRDLGVRVGVDDFGTGYSSLACLYRLPLDLLKVDQSFVHGMLESDEHHAIVQTIITLAQHLHLDVIAEGIESEGQRRELASLACPYGQGYLFSPPVSAEEVKHLLRKHQRSADKHSRLTIYGPAENSQLAESGLGLPTNDPVLLPSDDSRTSHPHGA
ncbi:MAG: EAL domain-containing protein, partial [Planctomycetales bacterium]|nr:EAL domain-containing protein [Planctomycetales bacterium]